MKDILAFNRTIVELKQEIIAGFVSFVNSFNRTIVELKHVKRVMDGTITDF